MNMGNLVVILLLTVPGGALAATPTSGRPILAKYKAATGGQAWNRVKSMRVKTTKKIMMLSGSSTTLIDLLHGRLVTHATIGPVKIVAGSNGKVAWDAKGHAAASKVTQPSKLKSMRSSTYRAARDWWFPKRWSATMAVLGKKTDEGKSFWVVKITPKGGSSFEVWINTKTNLLARVVTADETTVVSDYRSVHGIKIPFKQQSRETAMGHTINATAHVQSVVLNVPVSANDFAMPTSAAK